MRRRIYGVSTGALERVLKLFGYGKYKNTSFDIQVIRMIEPGFDFESTDETWADGAFEQVQKTAYLLVVTVGFQIDVDGG